jgi:hypothetical protein
MVEGRQENNIGFCFDYDTLLVVVQTTKKGLGTLTVIDLAAFAG